MPITRDLFAESRKYIVDALSPVCHRGFVKVTSHTVNNDNLGPLACAFLRLSPWARLVTVQAGGLLIEENIYG